MSPVIADMQKRGLPQSFPSETAGARQPKMWCFSTRVTGVVRFLGPAQARHAHVLLPVDEFEPGELVPDELPVHELGQTLEARADDLDMDDRGVRRERLPDREGLDAAVDLDGPAGEAEGAEMDQRFLDGVLLGPGHGHFGVLLQGPDLEEPPAAAETIRAEADVAGGAALLEFLDPVPLAVVLPALELDQVRRPVDVVVVVAVRRAAEAGAISGGERGRDAGQARGRREARFDRLGQLRRRRPAGGNRAARPAG